MDATAQVRQQWASKTFNNYDYMIGDLKRCEPIIEKIGNVNFVAPTIGKNVSYLDGGFVYHGEFTLEAVGTLAVASPIFPCTWGRRIVHRELSFTHEGTGREIDWPPNAKPIICTILAVSFPMKNGLVSLASMLGGILFITVALVFPPLRNVLFNYHQFFGSSYGSL